MATPLPTFKAPSLKSPTMNASPRGIGVQAGARTDTPPHPQPPAQAGTASQRS
jgi:hypothetical protein